jgi:hypothetical protein
MSTTAAPEDTNIISKVKKSSNEMTKRMIELLVGAFTLVTALTWKDAVQSAFAKGGVFDIIGRWGPWVNAICITILVYFLTMWLKKYLSTPCTSLCAQTVQGIASAAAQSASAAAAAAQSAAPAMPPCKARRRRRSEPTGVVARF